MERTELTQSVSRYSPSRSVDWRPSRAYWPWHQAVHTATGEVHLTVHIFPLALEVSQDIVAAMDPMTLPPFVQLDCKLFLALEKDPYTGKQRKGSRASGPHSVL